MKKRVKNINRIRDILLPVIYYFLIFPVMFMISYRVYDHFASYVVGINRFSLALVLIALVIINMALVAFITIYYKKKKIKEQYMVVTGVIAFVVLMLLFVFYKARITGLCEGNVLDECANAIINSKYIVDAIVCLAVYNILHLVLGKVLDRE